MGAHRNSGQTTDEIGKEQEKEKHTRLRSQHSLSPLELLQPHCLDPFLFVIVGGVRLAVLCLRHFVFLVCVRDVLFFCIRWLAFIEKALRNAPVILLPGRAGGKEDRLEKCV